MPSPIDSSDQHESSCESTTLDGASTSGCATGPGYAKTAGYTVAPGYELAPVERIFCELVEIDSPSFHEHEMSAEVRSRLEALGFTVVEDNTQGKNDGLMTAVKNTRRFGQLTTTAIAYQRLLHTDSDCGNLFATLPGIGALADADPILFITHVDTVLPAHGKHAVVHEDGTITSQGDTVLGADDLAAIAEVMAAVEHLQATGVAHRPIELACMVAEEVGNIGARAFDWSQCRASMAYTLDYSGDPSDYAYQAPTIIYFTTEVLGRSAHAGFYPELGVHAIKIAAHAIDQIECGHVDEDTTVNVGIISGGRGLNVVPGTCVVRGEVRSYVHERAEARIEDIKAIFEQAATEFGGTASTQVGMACHAYHTPEDADVIKRYEAACRNLGLTPHGSPTFGGSDNNVAAAYGIPGIVIANGMREAHSTHEHVNPHDLETIQAIVEQLLTMD